MIDCNRRLLIAVGMCLPLRARADAAELLRRGRVSLPLRHAATEPGIGDPENFRLDDCSTQRNLSHAGRQQARRIGRWFAQRRLRPARVRSSPWCRCLETARLAFGEAEPWDALGSNFNRTEGARQRTDAVAATLAALRSEAFEVWVTHQVNISALTAASPAMGTAVVARALRDRNGELRVDNAGLLSFD